MDAINHCKIFGFMINPHEMLLVSEDGQKLVQIGVDSDAQAKEKFMSEALNQQLIHQLGRPDFSTIWSDDPAGDQGIIEACKKMEQAQADALLAGAMDGDQAPATEPNAAQIETSEQSIPNDNGEVSVHTLGTIFQIEVDGEFKNIPGQLLKIDDVCRFFPEREQIDTTLWSIVASPVNSGDEGSGDFIVQLKKVAEPAEESSAQPQFAATGSTKIIDVECATTRSEEHIKGIVRRLQSLKGEALASAASYREDIKGVEKELFEACNGKSYTSMECAVENNWEAGIRRYIRPDTGEVAKEEQIPYEEQQLNMNSALDEATLKTEEHGEAGSSELAAEGETTTADDTELLTDEEERGDVGPDDFPPPEEMEVQQ
jgi:hypothetical protein